MLTQKLQTACKRTAIAAAITMGLVVGIPTANANTALDETVNAQEVTSEISERSEGLANYAEDFSSEATDNSQDDALLNDQSDDSENLSTDESDDPDYVSTDESDDANIVSNKGPSDLATEGNQLASEDNQDDDNLEDEHGELASNNDSYDLQDESADNINETINAV